MPERKKGNLNLQNRYPKTPTTHRGRLCDTNLHTEEKSTIHVRTSLIQMSDIPSVQGKSAAHLHVSLSTSHSLNCIQTLQDNTQRLVITTPPHFSYIRQNKDERKRNLQTGFHYFEAASGLTLG